MPYLAFDLDAKKKVGPCARAVGVEPGVIAWGLLELWEHVWLSKSASVNEMVLDGCFGPNARMREALVTYDFLEQVPDGYRVKGAERYLRVTESRVRAGKARAAGAGRSAGRFASATSTLPAHAGEPTSTSPALTPSTEHRAPNALEALRVASQPPAFELVVEPKLKKQKAPKTEKPPDPRHTPMKLKLIAASPGYAFDGRDAKALSLLLAKGADEEILLRWARALIRTGYPTVRTLPELEQHWAHFAAGGATGPPRDVTRGIVRAQDVDRKSFEKTGVIDGF